jgi:hypothetical protein
MAHAAAGEESMGWWKKKGIWRSQISGNVECLWGSKDIRWMKHVFFNMCLSLKRDVTILNS